MQPLSTNATVHNLVHQSSSVHSIGSTQYSNSTEDSTTYTNLNYDQSGAGTPGGQEPAGQEYVLPDNHSQGKSTYCFFKFPAVMWGIL